MTHERRKRGGQVRFNDEYHVSRRMYMRKYRMQQRRLALAALAEKRERNVTNSVTVSACTPTLTAMGARPC